MGNFNEVCGVWALLLWLSLPALLNPLPTQSIHFKCSICSLELHEGIPGKKKRSWIESGDRLLLPGVTSVFGTWFVHEAIDSGDLQGLTRVIMDWIL